MYNFKTMRRGDLRYDKIYSFDLSADGGSVISFVSSDKIFDAILFCSPSDSVARVERVTVKVFLWYEYTHLREIISPNCRRDTRE